MPHKIQQLGCSDEFFKGACVQVGAQLPSFILFDMSNEMWDWSEYIENKTDT